MKKPLVIFGTGDIAQLAHYYFSHDSDYEVVAFTVDAAYVKEPTFLNLPVVPFESVAQSHAPDSHHMFIAVSYAKLNRVRKEKYLAARELGYPLASYVSSTSVAWSRPPSGKTASSWKTTQSSPLRVSATTSRCGAAIISAITPRSAITASSLPTSSFPAA